MLSSRNRNAGFTLTEIMVVILVFGIAVAIAFPMLADAIRTQRLMTAASTIESELARARSSAVTTRDPVRVTFIPAINQLLLDRDTTGDGNFDMRVRAVTIDPDIDMTDIQFDGGQTVVFDQRGTPDNPGTLMITNGNGSAQRILVASGSGAVTVRTVEYKSSEGYGDLDPPVDTF